MQRRDLLKLTAGLFVTGIVNPVLAINTLNKSARVIIVGAGQAGLTVANHLISQNSDIAITLFDSNIHQALNNLNYIDGVSAQEAGSLLLGGNIKVINEQVFDIEFANKYVKSVTGHKEYYDFLVVSPGVEFDQSGIELDSTVDGGFITAWKNPSKEAMLWDQIKSMDKGGVIVISAPELPYRYPVGPYLRANRIANYLYKYNPTAKLMVLDEKNVFPHKEKFLVNWREAFPAGMVEWVSKSEGGQLLSIIPSENKVVTTQGSIKAQVVNYIPRQQAGHLATRTNLADKSGWCPVMTDTLQSKKYQDVYVVGDANSLLLDKSSRQARAQASLCARHILSQMA